MRVFIFALAVGAIALLAVSVDVYGSSKTPYPGTYSLKEAVERGLLLGSATFAFVLVWGEGIELAGRVIARILRGKGPESGGRADSAVIITALASGAIAALMASLALRGNLGSLPLTSSVFGLLAGGAVTVAVLMLGPIFVELWRLLVRLTAFVVSRRRAAQPEPLGWVCPQCGRSNGATRYKCAGCLETRPPES